MNLTKLQLVLPVIAMLILACPGFAENIDPYDDGSQYAWGENVGWLNFEPNTGDGVQVSSTELTGYIWAENIGWINLSPASYGGIVNDGAGNLAGFAWAENVGWLSFSCINTKSCDSVDYGVTIDADGAFDGYAWGENIGWIHFQSASPVAYKVQACVVTFEDLANFTALWLQAGSNAADLDDEADGVDLEDYAIFSSFWQDYCPGGWQLK